MPDYNFAPSKKLAAAQGLAKGLQDWIKQQQQIELNKQLRKAELFDKLQLIKAEQAGAERLQTNQLTFQREQLTQTGELSRLGMSQAQTQFEKSLAFQQEELDYRRLSDIADRRFKLEQQRQQQGFMQSMEAMRLGAARSQFEAEWSNRMELAGIEAENARDLAEFTWGERAKIADLDRQMDMSIAALRYSGAEAQMTDAQKQYLSFSKQAISSLLSTLPMVAFAGAQSGMDGEEIARSLNQVYDLINIFTEGSNQIFQGFGAPMLPTPRVGVEEAGRKIFSIPPFKKQTRPVLVPRQAPEGAATGEPTTTMETPGALGPPAPEIQEITPAQRSMALDIANFVEDEHQRTRILEDGLTESEKNILRERFESEEEISAIEAEVKRILKKRAWLRKYGDY